MTIDKPRKLLPYLPFLFSLTTITQPKTQRLIDDFQVYNTKGDYYYKNRNQNNNNNNNNRNGKDAYDDNETNKWKTHQAHIPGAGGGPAAISPTDSLLCESSLINGRKRTICSDRGLEKIPRGISSETTILHLESNRLKKLTARAFIKLSSLQSLYLNNNAISAVDVDAFEGLINLSELDLSHNVLRSIKSATFRGFPHLQVGFEFV